MVTRRSAMKMLAAAGRSAGRRRRRPPSFNPTIRRKWRRRSPSGKPVVVHVYAPWCLQCHIQAHYLDGLKDDPEFKDVAFFRVDYDHQKDVVAKLDCPRSTVIAYKGGKEVSRMSWGITKGAVVDVLKAAIVSLILALPLAFAAGLLTILSPCILPLAPIVVAAARADDPRGPFALALGLALTFAVVGGGALRLRHRGRRGRRRARRVRGDHGCRRVVLLLPVGGRQARSRSWRARRAPRSA